MAPMKVSLIYLFGYLKGLVNFPIVAGRILEEVFLINDGETDRLILSDV